jgi:Asp-tRNA(Asn)/Glu-tRNA(Gln) amidotransferase A subunit family amidase
VAGDSLLFDLPLKQLADAVRSGTHSPVELVHRLCDRIESVDGVVQALLPEPKRRERLQYEAEDLLLRWPDPAGRPALFGMPVGVKDLFNADGFATRAGSQLPPECFDGEESPVVTQLKLAGALILGKTHCDEFAYTEPAPTRNPHNPDHTPGGSSSGSAAGVAAGLFPLALGTQTTRSIIGPAAWCGVVGFKPSHGSLATEGCVALSPAFDTVGLLAQDLEGIRLAWSALGGSVHASQAPTEPVIGIPDDPFLQPIGLEARAVYEAQVFKLREAGWPIVRIPFPDAGGPKRVYKAAMVVLHAEMAEVHADWFDEHQERYRPQTRHGVLGGRDLPDDGIAEAYVAQSAWREELAQLTEDAGIDCWLLPSSNGPAPAGDRPTGYGQMVIPWSFAGVPAVSLPLTATADGLPLGLQLAGRRGEDGNLLHWAGRLTALLSP